jgi:hypothetical protein
MVKPSKQFRKQAEKAEAAAQRTEDPEHADLLRTLADAFRAQANAIKAAGKAEKPEKK